MKKQTVMWTALPNGVTGSPGTDNARLRLSVFVSPRLQSDEGSRPTLSQFPDFLTWPDEVGEMQFSVEFGTGAAIAAERVLPPDDPPAGELWAGLFDADTYVEPYEFPDLSTRIIHSFPVRNVMSRLKETYTKVAIESPIKIPRLTPENQQLQGVRKLFQHIGVSSERSAQISSALGSQIRTAPLKVIQNPTYEAPTSKRAVLGQARVAQVSSPLADVEPATVEFHQVKAFHQPALLPRVAMPKVQDLVASIDFHRILSSLGAYPQLMRRLGVVIDLEVPFDAALVGAVTVRVVPQWTSALGAAHSDVTPRTHCVLTNQVFHARPGPEGADLRDGMMCLDDDDRFEVGQFDVDGAALKTLELARKVTLTPALRVTPRALRMGARLRTVEGAPEKSEVAEVDELKPEPEEAALPALRSSGIWVARVNRAVTLATALQRSATLNLAVVQKRDDEVFLYAEDLVRGYRPDVWDDASGQWYSLCRRVGGYRFTKSGLKLTLEDEGWVSTAATEAPDGSSDLRVHEVLFRWEGWSLCAPRPGKAVESAESAAPTPAFGLDASFVAAGDSLPRLRFGTEYRLRARAVDLAGNGLSLEEADDSAASDPLTYFRHEPLVAPVLIPRTELSASPGESVERAVIRSFNNRPGKDEVRTNERSQRHVAPPKTSQLMAETHGKFDDSEGMMGDVATYNLIVRRDVSLAGAYDTSRLKVPYLSDPLAEGVLIRIKPLFAGEDAEEQILRIPFEGTWPRLTAFRIMLYEDPDGKTEAAFDADYLLLRVPLAKAETADIIVSTYTKPKELPRLGMWRWITEGIAAPAIRQANLPKAQTMQVFRQLHETRKMPQWMNRVKLSQAQVKQVTQLKEDAEEGKHWMLTPHRHLVVVHAVQQPLIIPAWQQLKTSKGIGATYATVLDQMPISGKSTAKLDIQAEWEEPIDALSEPRPHTLSGKADVGEVPIRPQHTQIGIRQRHEFGDTKYRRVSYTAVAASRFREYFDPEKVTSGQLDLTRTSEKMAVDVLNSARPSPPKVLYVIPTFGWQREQTKNSLVSTRRGGGLRVYLERPWYSSGDGELLGVVLYQSPQQRQPILTMVRATQGTKRLAQHVTLWGQDPLWKSAAVQSAGPPVAAFTLASTTESNLTLEEVPGTKVSVAGHEVGYDEERQLWYCDIEIDPGDAYFPFVRMALARYQPMSVQGPQGDVKLSRVVLADFAQLAPDRSATVVFDSQDATKLTVTVTGASYAASAVGPQSSQIEVGVEKKLENAGALGWVPASDEAFALQRSKGRGIGGWTGTVTLPAARDSQPFRLVIKEYELLFTDKVQTGVLTAVRLEAGRRLVYADALEI